MKKNRLQLFTVLRGSLYLLSLNLLVFLRRSLGERVVVDMCFAFGFGCVAYCLYVSARRHLFPLLQEPCLAPVFLHTLSALIVCHIFCIILRRNKPATIHSFSTGRPLEFWRFIRASDTTLQRYVQPAACLLVALGLSRWDLALAWWIGAASVAVFVEEQLARLQMRRRVLDTIDGRIESQTLYGRVQERISPTDAATTQTPVIEVAEASGRTTGSLDQITGRLDPELRKMLEAASAPNNDNPK